MGTKPCVLVAMALLVGAVTSAEVVVPVSTAQELLTALSDAASPGAPVNTVVQLLTDVSLSQEAAAGFQLPFVIPSNHTLTLEAGGLAKPEVVLAAAQGAVLVAGVAKHLPCQTDAYAVPRLQSTP
jgi:hypothetical protein